MNNPFRSGLAAIALALFGGGIAMLADHRELAILLCAAGGLFGLVVVIITAVAEYRFRVTREGIGKLLEDSDELMYRAVSNEEQFRLWTINLNSWSVRTKNFLAEKLSSTDAAIFWDISEGGRYRIHGAFNGEHADQLNTLGKYVRNLKGIASRYLSARS